MNLNLALCLNAPLSTAADVCGARPHLETTWFLPPAPSCLSVVPGEQPALSREVGGCWGLSETFWGSEFGEVTGGQTQSCTGGRTPTLPGKN